MFVPPSVATRTRQRRYSARTWRCCLRAMFVSHVALVMAFETTPSAQVLTFSKLHKQSVVMKNIKTVFMVNPGFYLCNLNRPFNQVLRLSHNENIRRHHLTEPLDVHWIGRSRDRGCGLASLLVACPLQDSGLHSSVYGLVHRLQSVDGPIGDKHVYDGPHGLPAV